MGTSANFGSSPLIFSAASISAALNPSRLAFLLSASTPRARAALVKALPPSRFSIMFVSFLKKIGGAVETGSPRQQKYFHRQLPKADTPPTATASMTSEGKYYRAALNFRSRFERGPRGCSCSVIVESSSAVLLRQGSHNPSGSVARSLHLPGWCPCDLDGHLHFIAGYGPHNGLLGSHESNPLTEVLVPRSLRPNEHPLMACVAVLAAWRCSWRCAKLH